MKKLVLAVLSASVCISAFAQPVCSIKAKLQEKGGEPVGFATVSLTVKGKTAPYKYTLSSETGEVSFDKLEAGSYIFKAENMGYISVSRDVEIKRGELDLGSIVMEIDSKTLDAANISAVGNSIIMKKDTIEYNANAFKTTENDVLEDLLKKLPGVEVDESGSVTFNGKSISKITVDGKTFFLNDPQLATKNIPAKIVEKIKVVQKKSEQAEFTRIDDGEEEQIIDLNIKKGMMKGLFGNLMAGAGHDAPSTKVSGDYRFQGAGFMGKFTDKSQISVIANANNTNNRAFNDLAGSMMGGMMGGEGMYGGGRGGNRSDNGISASYMGGVNGSWTLFGDKMELAGNYLYNNTNTDIIQNSYRQTYLKDASGKNYNRINDSDGGSSNKTYGNRFGVRLEHKFSENTSILFEPQLNFGGGRFSQTNDETISNDYLNGSAATKLNSSNINNSGENKNITGSGWFLFRQRLGMPGRTFSTFIRYSLSDNDLDGFNISDTKYFNADGTLASRNAINQFYNSNQKNYSISARATYTEPLGGFFYAEASYGYNWNKSTSYKHSYDHDGTSYSSVMNYQYSNDAYNEMSTQSMSVNFMYQREKSRAQIGFSAMPTRNYNRTTRYTGSAYESISYDPGVKWNFAPQAMAWLEFNENANARVFYRGHTSQPSISKLMSIPDVSNPLSVSFGNSYLNPYFSHDLHADYRYSNRKNFSSMNIRLEGSYVQDPIVNAIWYGDKGAQYSMPFNGPSSMRANMFSFLNAPIAKSNFSVSNMLRLSYSNSGYYVGDGIDMTKYYGGDYYGFIDDFLGKYRDNLASNFVTNSTTTFGATERLRLKYGNDATEVQLSGRTRVNKSWYKLGKELSDNTMTFNNQVSASFTWNWEAAGISLKSESSYNWYKGYSTDMKDEFVIDAEIQKLLFGKRVSLSLKGYDILGQARNLSVTDNDNYHSEVYNNTLGRYIILSLTYRFGTFDKSRMRGGPPHAMRGPRP